MSQHPTPNTQHPVITVVGLGPGDMDALSVGALREIETAGWILARTERHPVVEPLRARGVEVRSLDSEYDAAPDFQTLYQRLAQRVLEAASAGDVVYAVPGHPLIGERSVLELLRRAGDVAGGGTQVRIVPASSFLDVVLPALARAQVALPGEEFDLRDGTTTQAGEIRPSVPAFYFQVYDRDVASAVKLALLQEYPEVHTVHVVRWAGIPGKENVTSLPLYELDRPSSGVFDHLTTLYVPAAAMEQRRPTFADLVEVTARLRGPGGCPWDREQTYQSLKRFMLEEAYEAVEAVDSGEPARLCDELGDVLFQVLINAQLAREDGDFDIRDVIANVTSKLIRRHPHVFGDVQVADSAEVLRNWEAIKRSEKPERTSVLDGVTASLPALMKAMEVSKRVVKVGFEWPTWEHVFDKLDDEILELRGAIKHGERKAIEHEVGDILFTVVNLARFLEIDPEEALRSMVARFSQRFRLLEQMAAGGRPLEERTIDELDELWEQAKAQLK